MTIPSGRDARVTAGYPTDNRIISNQARPWWGLWYFGLPILTAGIFAAIPFVHAARRLHRPALWRWAAFYGALGILQITFMSVPENQTIPAIGGLLMLGTMVASCVQLSPIRREAYGLSRPVMAPSWEPAAADPAVAAALAARRRRQAARELADRDQLIARDLGIGRPDLGRGYDDGGLVDLNNAPAAVIARACEIDQANAARIVVARDQLGGSFSNVDEVFVLADVPASTWDRIRDRAVLLPN